MVLYFEAKTFSFGSQKINWNGFDCGFGSPINGTTNLV
jgi:hypothetical protein